MSLRSEDKKVREAALPLFTVDTPEEAQSLITLFGSLVHTGPLAGNHVLMSVNRAGTDEQALAAMAKIQGLMAQTYGLMRNR